MLVELGVRCTALFLLLIIFASAVCLVGFFANPVASDVVVPGAVNLSAVGKHHQKRAGPAVADED